MGHETQSQAETSPSLINKQGSVVHYLSRFLCHTLYAISHMHLNRSDYILAINVILCIFNFYTTLLIALIPILSYFQMTTTYKKFIWFVYLWAICSKTSLMNPTTILIDIQCHVNHSVLTSKTTCPSDHQ